MQHKSILDSLLDFPYQMYQWVTRAMASAPVTEPVPHPTEPYTRPR